MNPTAIFHKEVELPQMEKFRTLTLGVKHQNGAMELTKKKIVTYIDLKDMDPFTQSPFQELMEEQHALGMPYVLANVQCVGSSHFFDAKVLYLWKQKNNCNPLTREKIQNVYYHTIWDKAEQEFTYIGSDCELDPLKKKFIQTHFINEVHIALNNIGLSYFHGKGVKKDAQLALKCLLKPALNGHAVAQYNLARVYSEMYSNHKEGGHWFKKAADQGLAAAQLELGQQYTRGLHCDKDDRQAFEWFKKAAEQSHVQAEYMLADSYLTGRRVDQDDKKGIEWLFKAADHGLMEAQFLVGFLSFKGLGVDKDLNKAHKWFQKAADQGDIESQRQLGFIYLKGLGIDKDLKKAREWFQKAADQGDMRSQRQLAFNKQND